MSTSSSRGPIRRSSPGSTDVGSALAVLLAGGRYVMQLRDTKPEIPDPGVWALFGGRIEPGETPSAALVREIEEELGIRLADYRFFGKIGRDSERAAAQSQYWIFEADITRLWGRHSLAEGQAVNRFRFEELRTLAIPAFIRALLERHYSETTLRRTHVGGPRTH